MTPKEDRRLERRKRFVERGLDPDPDPWFEHVFTFPDADPLAVASFASAEEEDEPRAAGEDGGLEEEKEGRQEDEAEVEAAAAAAASVTAAGKKQEDEGPGCEGVVPAGAAASAAAAGKAFRVVLRVVANLHRRVVLQIRQTPAGDPRHHHRDHR